MKIFEPVDAHSEPRNGNSKVAPKRNFLSESPQNQPKIDWNGTKMNLKCSRVAPNIFLVQPNPKQNFLQKFKKNAPENLDLSPDFVIFNVFEPFSEPEFLRQKVTLQLKMTKTWAKKIILDKIKIVYDFDLSKESICDVRLPPKNLEYFHN